MANSIDQFRTRIIRSGLVPAEKLTSFFAPSSTQPASVEELTQSITQNGMLTSFQLERIARGDGASLKLDHYVIKERIGAGGMGEVFLAEHQQMERHVAIKILSAELGTNAELVQRFRREVKAAARLIHPNIVTAFDANECDGTQYLVMEWVQGDDLATVVNQDGPMSLHDALDVIEQTATGLMYAHERGVIHRDIKPSNLLLDLEGNIKILDMGLARLESPGNPSHHPPTDGLTATGMVMGTLDYMAPEQALDTRLADARSDIYSLGCTLFFVLTQRPLFREDTLTKKLLALQDKEPPSLRECRDDVTPGIEALYRKMVAKDPASRFQSMGELLESIAAMAPESASCVAFPSDDPAMKDGSATGDVHSFDLESDRDTTPETSVSSLNAVPLSVEANATSPLVLQSQATTSESSVVPTRGLVDAHLDARSISDHDSGSRRNALVWLGVGTGAVLVVACIAFAMLSQRGGTTGDTSVSPALPAETTSPDQQGSVDRRSGGTERPIQKTHANFALEFDGVDDLVFVDGFSHPRSQPVTFEATVVHSPAKDLKTQAQSVVTQHGSILLGNKDQFVAMLWNPNANRAVTSVGDATRVRPKQRYHVAVTWDQQYYRIFVNGKRVDQKRLTSMPEFAEQRWISIGGHVSKSGPDGGLCFPGLIDEVRISDVARYTKDYRPAERFEPDDATLALYHFDEGNGTVLKDASGNGHDGRIRGAKWVNADGSPIKRLQERSDNKTRP